jgi:hypothetical protein
MRTADDVSRHLLNYVPVPEKSELLRSEFEKSNVFMSPERNRRMQRRRVTPPHRSPRMLGTSGDQKEPSPRPNEWPRKQHERASLAKRPEVKHNRSRPPVARATQSVTPSVQEEEIDEVVFQPGGHEPEFNGPEPPSSNLLDHLGPSFSAKDVIVVAESGTAINIPVSKVDSFYNSDYTRYVSASKEDYASPPDVLGIVKVAERTLSHQRHYNLTARDRTLELVAQASRSSKSVAKLPSRR